MCYGVFWKSCRIAKWCLTWQGVLIGWIEEKHLCYCLNFTVNSPLLCSISLKCHIHYGSKENCSLSKLVDWYVSDIVKICVKVLLKSILFNYAWVALTKRLQNFTKYFGQNETKIQSKNWVPVLCNDISYVISWN